MELVLGKLAATPSDTSSVPKSQRGHSAWLHGQQYVAANPFQRESLDEREWLLGNAHVWGSSRNVLELRELIVQLL